MPVPAETAEQFAERQTWRYRTIEATRGNQSQLGTILLAVLGKSRPLRAFGSNAWIAKDGGVLARWIDREGADSGVVRICHVNELTANFSGLADHLKLNDRDRIELFQAVRAWISADLRTLKEQLHFTVTQRG